MSMLNHAVANIRHDGFFCGLNLRRDALEEFRTVSLQATCFGDGNVKFPFRYVAGGMSQRQSAQVFSLGKYTNALDSAPVLRALTSDPQLLAISRGYLGTEPALIGARMWWSFVGPADTTQRVNAGQGFHYDIDGYRGLTVFFYLTDVTPSSGPQQHRELRTGKRNSPSRRLWPDEPALLQTLGEQT
jgi:hypothetical protein